MGKKREEKLSKNERETDKQSILQSNSRKNKTEVQMQKEGSTKWEVTRNMTKTRTRKDEIGKKKQQMKGRSIERNSNKISNMIAEECET